MSNYRFENDPINRDLILNNKKYDYRKLEEYLDKHDFVDATVFNDIRRDSNRNEKRLTNFQFSGDLNNSSISKEDFIKRLSLYLYEADNENINDLTTFIVAYENYYYDSKNTINFYTNMYDTLVTLLEEYQISAENIFNYYVDQSGNVDRLDVFELWLKYLKLAKQYQIKDYLPRNLYYSYNLALQKDIKEPLYYHLLKAPKKINDDNPYYIRDNDYLRFRGELPVDNNGKVCLRWVLLHLENAPEITTLVNDKNPLKVEFLVKITRDLKVFLPNYDKDEDEPDKWELIYAGPKAMNIDVSILGKMRKNLKLTQSEVADNIDVPLRTYQAWESKNNNAKPDCCSMMRILNYFNINDFRFLLQKEEIIDDHFTKFKEGTLS